MKCEKCGTEIEAGKICPTCDVNIPSEGEQNDHKSLIPKREYSMKWYKFLKVALWIGAIINFSQGTMRLIGNAYENMTDAVYEAVPALKGLDIFYGLALWALAALAIYAWYTLNEYKAIGPKALLAMYIGNIATQLIFAFAFSSIVANAEVTKIIGEAYEINGQMYRPSIDLATMSNNFVSTLTSVGITIAFAVYNYKYFAERDELFIN